MPSHIARNRYGVVALLVCLFAITYIDRVCISVAGPRMQADLHIDPVGWGWVTGMFTLAYCLFEIPAGVLADRLGPRRVLTRIVLWWSAFTAMTGLATGYYPLLVTRFLFGAGEAGAFPGASVVVTRWFPSSQRATMSGVNLMASQIGGALAPLLVAPIQMRYGWRASFFVFGVIGVIWAAVWYAYFRDSPSGTEASSAAVVEVPAAPGHHFPMRPALQSRTVLAVLGTAFCYIYVYNFFQTWFHTFLVKGRGFTESNLFLSALPYVLATCSNVAGGLLSDGLVKRWGPRMGRRAIGAAGLSFASLMTVAAMISRDGMVTLVCLSLVYAGITLQQASVFGVCMDISRQHAGAMIGLMNTSSQAGGLVGSVAYGYIVDRFGSYDAPFPVMATLLLIGALLWLRIDATETLGETA